MRRFNVGTVGVILGMGVVVALGAVVQAGEEPVGDTSEPWGIPKGQVISYTKDVRPILDKCAECHHCYDSPAQLDLANAKNIRRGAIKLDPYALRLDRIPLINYGLSEKEAREMGFFSVLDGGRDSIMAKMIELGHDHRWKENESIPRHIGIDSLSHSLFAPEEREIDGYMLARPKQGMPFAVADLTDQEYATIMTWLDRGAKFDEVKRQPTATELKAIVQWEAFLNADSNKHKLVARYIYEHLFPMHFYFDPADTGNFYKLIRSSTPPGREPVPISKRFANSEIKGPFYYRFALLDVVLTHKRHIAFDAAGKLSRYKEIFFSQDWKVDELPGYSIAERYRPLRTFAAIPAKARYRFLLVQGLPIEQAVMQGASCRGGLIVSVTPERGWYFFEDPETSLYVNNPEFRKAVAAMLDQVPEPGDLGAVIAAIKEVTLRNRKWAELAVNCLKDGSRSRIDDIWRGDQPDDIPAYTTFRHDGNAGGLPGLIGGYPRRVLVMDLAIAERRIYTAYVNFDLFGKVMPMVAHRDEFGIWRVNMELNYLRFLPADMRMDVLKGWYPGPLSRAKLGIQLPRFTGQLKTGVVYQTDNPQREFLDQLIKHIAGAVPTEDPIARPQPGVAYDRVTKAMQLIHAEAAKEGAKFKAFLPEATFLRIDSKGKDPAVYTMTSDWWVSSMNSLAAQLLHLDKPKDQVTIHPGVFTSYPNFIFTVDETEVMEFAEKLTAADNMTEFLSVVDRWGVRRTNPEFWETLDSITEYQRRINPRDAAIFDLNRYWDYDEHGRVLLHSGILPDLYPRL